MKKPEKKFELLSIGEIASLKDFIVKLSRKYNTLIKINFESITSSLKKELVEQLRIFESMIEIPDAELSNWLKSRTEESETEIKEKVRTDNFLNAFKKIFIIGGRDTTRTAIEKKLLSCGAEKVCGEPPMFEKNLDKKSLRKKLAGYNCVVFLTNYMGHAEYYMGKDIASETGIRIVHCSGGISRLLVELGKLKKKG